MFRSKKQIITKIKNDIDNKLPFISYMYRTLKHELKLYRAKYFSTPYGFKILNYGNNINCNNGNQFNNDREETELIRQILKNVEIFVDIGANIGFYSCLARSMGKKVIAFEPHIWNLRQLYLNIGENGWDDIEIWPIGLGDRIGSTMIFGTGTGASLLDGWAGVPKTWKHIISINMLDNVLVPRLNGITTFIKIDVEGYEFEVLKGAMQTLKLSPPPLWLVEITLNLHRPQTNKYFLDTFNIFRDNNYKIYTVGKYPRLIGEKELLFWVRADKVGWGGYNYLFIPNDYQLAVES